MIGGKSSLTITERVVADVIIQCPELTYPNLNTDRGKYVTYEIVIKTADIVFSLKHSRVRRRFSEFQWLRRHLAKHHKFNPPPKLPPRKFFGERFRTARIEERTSSLQNFLRWCFKQITYLSESALHLFVQTSLSIKQIEQIIQGRAKVTPLQAVLRSGEDYVDSPRRFTHGRGRFDHSQSMMFDTMDGSGNQTQCCCM